jgi:hypothetical protein
MPSGPHGDLPIYGVFPIVLYPPLDYCWIKGYFEFRYQVCDLFGRELRNSRGLDHGMRDCALGCPLACRSQGRLVPSLDAPCLIILVAAELLSDGHRTSDRSWRSRGALERIVDLKPILRQRFPEHVPRPVDCPFFVLPFGKTFAIHWVFRFWIRSFVELSASTSDPEG